jgi:hypothetical protein
MYSYFVFRIEEGPAESPIAWCVVAAPSRIPEAQRAVEGFQVRDDLGNVNGSKLLDGFAVRWATLCVHSRRIGEKNLSTLSQNVHARGMGLMTKMTAGGSRTNCGLIEPLNDSKSEGRSRCLR